MQIKLTDANEEALKALVRISERSPTAEVNIVVREGLAKRSEEVEAGRALIAQEKKGRKR